MNEGVFVFCVCWCFLFGQRKEGGVLLVFVVCWYYCLCYNTKMEVCMEQGTYQLEENHLKL